MYRLLVVRHLFSRTSKPAVRWMTRFAFIAFGVAMFAWISVHSIMTGLQGERIKILVEDHPHLLWESTPRSISSEQKESLLTALKSFSVTSIEYVLQTEGLMEVVKSEERGRVQGAGVVMRADSRLSSGDVLVGGELAQMTRLGLGTELRFRSVWNLEGSEIRGAVSGLLHPRDFDEAKAVVRLSVEDIESLIEQRNAISRIEIRLQNAEEAAMALDAVKDQWPGEWKTWRDLNKSLLVSLALEKNMMGLAMFFLVLLASLALYLSLSVRVVERTRQSALLLALGARARQVRNIFLIEGFCIGVVGVLFGVGLSLLFCWYIKHHFLLPEVYYSRRIPVDTNIVSVLSLCGLAMIMAFVASYFPAKQVSKIEIAQALK